MSFQSIRWMASALLVGLLLAWGAEAKGAADAAHFWLSTSSSGSSGPEAPAIGMTTGGSTTVYIWGRPQSGRQFRNVSLNLVASASGLDLMDGSFTIHNTIDVSTDRFEFLDDSSASPALVSEFTSAEVTAGSTDSLIGLGGFTLNGSAARGVGPICSLSEMDCETAGDGEPAWVLAEVTIDAIAVGAVNLFLQIGDLGVNESTLAEGDYDFEGEVATTDHTLWVGSFGSTTLLAADGNDDGTVNAADYTVWRDHVGDMSTLGLSSATEVRFGVDAGVGLEPMHNASTDRSINLGGDDADAVVTIAAPASTVPEPGAFVLAAFAGLLFGVAQLRPRA